MLHVFEHNSVDDIDENGLIEMNALSKLPLFKSKMSLAHLMCSTYICLLYKICFLL